MNRVPSESPHESARLIVFGGGHVVDPASGREGRFDLLVEHGRIKDVQPTETDRSVPEGARVVDCRNGLVLPGLIEMRAFIGEPNAPQRETLLSLSQAALAGGITGIALHPDTVAGEPAAIDTLVRRARDSVPIHIWPLASVTHGADRAQLTDMGSLLAAGALGFSDGRASVGRADVMAHALAYASTFDALILHHVQEPTLSASGAMHDGETALRLGLAGIPAAAEHVQLARDIALLESQPARYHATVLSSAGSVQRIRQAKASGLPVTAGVSINNLMLTHRDVGDYRTFLRLSPPLRTEADREALVSAVADGTIDVIVSDHDPQDTETKRLPFEEAACGAVGLETVLAAGLQLVGQGKLSLSRLVDAMAVTPARVLNVDAGSLGIGKWADIVVVDPSESWRVDPQELASLSKNTPFENRAFTGRVVRCYVRGHCVFNRKALPSTSRTDGCVHGVTNGS